MILVDDQLDGDRSMARHSLGGYIDFADACAVVHQLVGVMLCRPADQHRDAAAVRFPAFDGLSVAGHAPVDAILAEGNPHDGETLGVSRPAAVGNRTFGDDGPAAAGRRARCALTDLCYQQSDDGAHQGSQNQSADPGGPSGPMGGHEIHLTFRGRSLRVHNKVLRSWCSIAVILSAMHPRTYIIQ